VESIRFMLNSLWFFNNTLLINNSLRIKYWSYFCVRYEKKNIFLIIFLGDYCYSSCSILCLFHPPSGVEQRLSWDNRHAFTLGITSPQIKLQLNRNFERGNTVYFNCSKRKLYLKEFKGQTPPLAGFYAYCQAKSNTSLIEFKSF